MLKKSPTALSNHFSRVDFSRFIEAGIVIGAPTRSRHCVSVRWCVVLSYRVASASCAVGDFIFYFVFVFFSFCFSLFLLFFFRYIETSHQAFAPCLARELLYAWPFSRTSFYLFTFLLVLPVRRFLFGCVTHFFISSHFVSFLRL